MLLSVTVAACCTVATSEARTLQRRDRDEHTKNEIFTTHAWIYGAVSERVKKSTTTPFIKKLLQITPRQV